MTLHFKNKKVVTGLDCETDGDKVWLHESSFTDSERPQLLSALKLYAPHLDSSTVFQTTMEEFDGLAETPLEWWDIADDSGSTLYQIWLYGVDSGAIFKNGSTELLGTLCQFGWDDCEVDDLPDLLEQAQAEIKKSDAKALLCRFDFSE